ncbi:MAG TPA: hypothetical protein VHW72_19840 [Candidatus Angelobacter sp.]|nr:hypothetical protein [Candidatus Angelobacter sp.]
MGVTIHFEGQLLDDGAFSALIEAATTFAKEWVAERTLRVAKCTLLRVRDEADWDYVGPVKGIQVFPHDDCDPIRLEFDRDLYIQQYTKPNSPVPTSI